jgi:hypothetical protein
MNNRWTGWIKVSPINATAALATLCMSRPCAWNPFESQWLRGLDRKTKRTARVETLICSMIVRKLSRVMRTFANLISVWSLIQSNFFLDLKLVCLLFSSPNLFPS